MIGICLTFKETRGPQRGGTVLHPHHMEHTLASTHVVGLCNFRHVNGHEMVGYCTSFPRHQILG